MYAETMSHWDFIRAIADTDKDDHTTQDEFNIAYAEMTALD